MRKLFVVIFIVASALLVACATTTPRNGYHVYAFPDKTGPLAGATYRGYWKNGTAHGQGTMTYSSGARHKGSWRNGRAYGPGTIISPNGATLTGNWGSNGQVIGDVTYRSANGKQKTGRWVNGRIVETETSSPQSAKRPLKTPVVSTQNKDMNRITQLHGTPGEMAPIGCTRRQKASLVEMKITYHCELSTIQLHGVRHEYALWTQTLVQTYKNGKIHKCSRQWGFAAPDQNWKCR